MNIGNEYGETLVIGFSGRVAKYFESTSQLLITYDVSKVSEADHKKITDIIDATQPESLPNANYNISDPFPNYDYDGSTIYKVKSVESLTERDLKGCRVSNTEILLFNVIDVRESRNGSIRRHPYLRCKK